MTNKPILILQMQRMGDLILSFPLMLWLARTYPDHPIFVAAENIFYEPLMSLSPAVTYFPWHGTDVLKQYDFELVVNLSIQEKAALLAGEVNAAEKIGPVQSADGSRFVHGDWQLYRTSLVGNNRYNRYHWAELNALDVVPFADIAGTTLDGPRTLAGTTHPVGLFLGASEEAKRPDMPLWGECATAIGKQSRVPILLAGPEEKTLGRAVSTFAEVSLDKTGQLALDELAALGQALSVLVTPDTGPMHLAAWTGTKCLNLSMGNVNPWETGPYSPGHYVLRADMDCAKGCWACTRDRLYCHDSFIPDRIALLVSKLADGCSDETIRDMGLPGLAVFKSGKSDDGLYHLQRIDQAPADEERLLSRFWQAFFGHEFGILPVERLHDAWRGVAEGSPEAAEQLIAHIPSMGREFTNGVRTGLLLDESFWGSSPQVIRPLTGYVHMVLENGDYKRAAWMRAVELLETLIHVCQ